MAGEIRVTPRVIRDESEHLRDLNTQFRAKVDELVSLEGQLSNSWDGGSKENFRNAFNTDKAKWDNFATAIDQFVQAMMTMYDKYVATEQRAQQIASDRSAR